MSELQSLDLLDISSVTNPASLFLYAVVDGDSRRMPASTLGASVLGGIKGFATLSKGGTEDVNATAWKVQSWTVVRTDTGGFRDTSSHTLLRIPNDDYQYAQLMYQWAFENYVGTNGPVRGQIVPGGLDQTEYTFEHTQDWNGNRRPIVQMISPVYKVKSGSYFYSQCDHSHSTLRLVQFERYQFFSMWAW